MKTRGSISCPQKGSVVSAPQDVMYLLDCLHCKGIGVILDWAPSQFLTDEHWPAFFDGIHLHGHADLRKGFQPDWKSFIFSYGRNDVRNFFISNALFRSINLPLLGILILKREGD